MTFTVRAFAPGRLNIIGEHVDYMGGEVFPAALNVGTSVAATVVLSTGVDATQPTRWSASVGGSDSSSTAWSFLPGTSEVGTAAETGWHKYVFGAVELTLAAVSVEHRRRIAALHIALGESTVPQGAGLSSSAALDVALVGALLAALDGRREVTPGIEVAYTHADRSAIALVAQQVEHQYCGVRCGIMDPFASAHGGCFLLDCATQHLSRVDLRAALDAMQCDVILVNSMVKHSLADGAYNRLRGALEEADSRIREATGVPSVAAEFKRLGFALLAEGPHDMDALSRADDVTAERFVALHRSAIDSLQLTAEQVAAVTYVGTEVVRTLVAHRLLTDAACASPEGAVVLGTLLNKTHRGLAGALHVSTEELDYIQHTLVAATATTTVAGEADGLKVLGARMMGGGFGGCVIALAQRDGASSQKQADKVRRTLLPGFTERFNVPAIDVYSVEAGCPGLHVTVDK